LGLAGALMQALTRNPPADPGLLGVNAGAAASVVVAIALLHLGSPAAQTWFALAGAAVAATAVHLLGSREPSSTSPVRIALAGATLSAILGAVVTGLVLGDRSAFNDYRFWSVGALAGRPLPVLEQTGGFMLVGAVLALGLARPLNAWPGEEAGRALGAHPGRTSVLPLLLADTLLLELATAGGEYARLWWARSQAAATVPAAAGE
jgi:iron complex transport system permease protein